jgi:hypothetical protein
MTMMNGWKSGATLNPTYGRPSWAVRQGVVYLSGSVDQPSGTNPVFTRLPLAARPAHRQYIMVYTNDSTIGFLTVYPTGLVSAKSSAPTNARQYTSLAAVSFPAAGMAMHKLNLTFGWKSSQLKYSTGNPAYNVSGGVVYLSGAVHQPAGSNQILAFLPKAAHPAHTFYITMYTDGGPTGQLSIEPNGAIQALGTAARSFTSLAGVSYPVASAARHKLTLLTGWTSGQQVYNTGDPAYNVRNGIVYLSGLLVRPGAAPDEFAVLPPGARPVHTLYTKAWMSFGYVGTIRIDPNGQMFAYSLPPSEGPVSLAAISFPLGS